jgi:TrkA domain protein
MAEAAIHTRTGVSVVAVIRGDEAFHAPGADFEIHVDDRVVAIGTAAGVAQLERELSGP